MDINNIPSHQNESIDAHRGLFAATLNSNWGRIVKDTISAITLEFLKFIQKVVVGGITGTSAFDIYYLNLTIEYVKQ